MAVTIGLPSYGVRDSGMKANQVVYKNNKVINVKNVKEALDVIFDDLSDSNIIFLPISQFPQQGESNKLYVDTTNDVLYYWDGTMYRSIAKEADAEVVTKTTAEWNALPTFKSSYGVIYIYSDKETIDGVTYPGLKVGDGLAYVVDLPFFADSTTVTPEEKQFWNGKVSVKIDALDSENVIFYTGYE